MKASLLLASAVLLGACSTTQSPSGAATTSAPPSQSATTAPTPTSAAAATPDSLPISLVTLSQQFTVAAGDYTVEWSVAAGAATECHFIISVQTPSTQGYAVLIETVLAGQQALSGTTDISLIAGTYKTRQTVENDQGGTPGCSRSWSATIKRK